MFTYIWAGGDLRHGSERYDGRPSSRLYRLLLRLGVSLYLPLSLSRNAQAITSFRSERIDYIRGRRDFKKYYGVR